MVSIVDPSVSHFEAIETLLLLAEARDRLDRELLALHRCPRTEYGVPVDEQLPHI